MGEDVSNKTLAILVGVAVVVSVVGLFLGAPGVMTGMQQSNETGYASANVLADVDLTAFDNNIFLGNLNPDETNRSEIANDNFTIGNVGKTVVDVDYWTNASLWQKSCAGTDTPQGGSPDACYQLRVMQNDSGAVQGSYTTYQNAWIGHASAPALINNLDTGDNFTVGINVTVPHYERAGSKNSSVWFEAVEHV